jgi:hypothetical protein
VKLRRDSDGADRLFQVAQRYSDEGDRLYYSCGLSSCELVWLQRPEHPAGLLSAKT